MYVWNNAFLKIITSELQNKRQIYYQRPFEKNLNCAFVHLLRSILCDCDEACD